MSAEQLNLEPIRSRRQVVDATVDITMILAGRSALRPKLMQEMAMAAARSCADVPDLLLEVARLREIVARQEREHGQTIDERDRTHEVADKLSWAIAPMEVIGEHSSSNDPWQNALDIAHDGEMRS